MLTAAIDSETRHEGPVINFACVLDARIAADSTSTRKTASAPLEYAFAKARFERLLSEVTTISTRPFEARRIDQLFLFFFFFAAGFAFAVADFFAAAFFFPDFLPADFWLVKILSQPSVNFFDVPVWTV